MIWKCKVAVTLMKNSRKSSQTSCSGQKSTRETATFIFCLSTRVTRRHFELGIEKGERRAFLKMVLKALTKKFGIIPAEYREKIAQLDAITLEALTEEIDDFKTIEDVKRFLAL